MSSAHRFFPSIFLINKEQRKPHKLYSGEKENLAAEWLDLSSGGGKLVSWWHCASPVADQEHVYLYIMIIMTTCTTQTAMCRWNAKVPQEQRGRLEKNLVCSDSWEMTGLWYSFQTYCFGFSSLDVQYWPFPGSFSTFYCWTNLCVLSFWSCLQSQSVLGLGTSWPRQPLGSGAMALLAGGLCQGNCFGGFGIAGFHQVVFTEWEDTEMIILALLSYTYCQYLNGFCWNDFVPSSSQSTKAHSVSAGVFAFLFPNLNRVNVTEPNFGCRDCVIE